jgi:hypothetical protein
MHCCKATQEQLIEAGLSDPGSDLLEQIGKCEACQREFYQLSKMLRSTRRLFTTVELSDNYWRGYHEKLQAKLTAADTVETRQSNWLRQLVFASIRVPVPVGMAAIVLLACAFIYGSRQTVQPIVIPTPHVVQVAVEVPVVQEKIVTRVVYKERKVSQQGFGGQSADESIVAQKRRSEPMSLTGFKPLDEVKLTVIKGGSPDEK